MWRSLTHRQKILPKTRVIRLIEEIALLDLYDLRQRTVPCRYTKADLKEYGPVAWHVERDHEGDGHGDEGETAVLRRSERELGVEYATEVGATRRYTNASGDGNGGGKVI